MYFSIYYGRYCIHINIGINLLTFYTFRGEKLADFRISKMKKQLVSYSRCFSMEELPDEQFELLRLL